MTEMILRHPRFYAVQNGFAALFFSLLLGAELLRHLLSSFPGVEIYWRLASLSNRTVMPLLSAVSDVFNSPVVTLVILGTGVLLPLVAWRYRHWLGTAISGHVALGCLVMITWWALKRNNTGTAMASLSDAFSPRLYDTSVVSLSLLSLAMAALCILNHVAFFRLSGR
jgi:hypothetical protein